MTEPTAFFEPEQIVVFLYQIIVGRRFGDFEDFGLDVEGGQTPSSEAPQEDQDQLRWMTNF